MKEKIKKECLKQTRKIQETEMKIKKKNIRTIQETNRRNITEDLSMAKKR